MKLWFDVKLWCDKYYHKNSRSYTIRIWAKGIYISFGLVRIWLPFWGWESETVRVRQG